jgi:hypothetical protein
MRMADRDPYDVVGVLRVLTHRLTAALAPMAGDGWRCQRVLPRIDGTAALVISGPLPDATYNWVAPPSPEEPNDRGRATWHWGRLRPPEDAGDPQVTRQVTRLLSATLARALARPAFAMLRWCNRHLTALRFDDAVVDVMLADRLAPGRSRWFDHVFREAFQDQADHFLLVFAGPLGDLQFSVTAPGVTLSAGELLLKHRLFCLWLREDPRPEDARGRVPFQVERFLGFLLSRSVHPSMHLRGGDGSTHAGRTPGGGATTSWRGAPVSTSRWGNPLQWHQFFSDFEVSRSGLCNVQFNEPVAYVMHGEPECNLVEPQIRPRTHTYTRMPFRQVRPDSRAPESRGRKFVSLITERETVLGGDDSLEAALDRAARDPHTQLIYINNTCLPKMVGDDLDSLVSRLAARTDKPILNLNTDLDSPDASYRHMLAQAEQHATHPPDARPVSPRAVSFLGFARGPYRRELGRLLEALEVEVAAFLVPTLDVQGVWLYRAGCAQVIYPRDAWQRLHAELFGDLDTPVLDVPAPYGLRDTRRWLEVIAGAAGRQDAFDECWPRLAEEETRRFEALRARVDDRRVGAVVTPESAPRLYGAERLYGVRLLPLLEELGFGLDVLLLDPDPAATAAVDEAEAGLRSCLEDPTRLTVHRFDSPAALARRLADAPCPLVYSEVACDHRLSRAGKTGFSLEIFEMGLAGAVRSLERLLTLERWPFYRRYAGWLAPRPELAPGPEESG